MSYWTYDQHMGSSHRNRGFGYVTFNDEQSLARLWQELRGNVGPISPCVQAPPGYCFKEIKLAFSCEGRLNNNRIFVGGLDYRIGLDEFGAIFAVYGSIKSLFLSQAREITHAFSHRMREPMNVSVDTVEYNPIGLHESESMLSLYENRKSIFLPMLSASSHCQYEPMNVSLDELEAISLDQRCADLLDLYSMD